MVKKVLISICFIIIGISIFLGLKTKASFVELPPLHELKKINPPISYISTEEDYRSLEYYYKYDIQDLDDLINSSDLVLEVQPLDEGTAVASALLRKSKVLRVIKGEYNNEEVYVYEPSHFIHTRSYMCIQGYVSMIESESYVIFLQKIDVPKNMKKDTLQNGYFFTNASLGKFKLGQDAILSDFNDDKEIYFNDIYELSVLFKLQKDVDLYNKLLKELEVRYKYVE